MTQPKKRDGVRRELLVRGVDEVRGHTPKLSVLAKLLFAYVRSGPQSPTVPGLGRFSIAKASEDLEVGVRAIRKATAELERAGVMFVDERAGVAFVPFACTERVPATVHYVTGWGNAYADIPECPLKERGTRTLCTVLAAKGQEFLAEFARVRGVDPSMDRASATKASTDTEPPTGTGDPLHARARVEEPAPAGAPPEAPSPDDESPSHVRLHARARVEGAAAGDGARSGGEAPVLADLHARAHVEDRPAEAHDGPRAQTRDPGRGNAARSAVDVVAEALTTIAEEIGIVDPIAFADRLVQRAPAMNGERAAMVIAVAIDRLRQRMTKGKPVERPAGLLFDNIWPDALQMSAPRLRKAHAEIDNPAAALDEQIAATARERAADAERKRIDDERTEAEERARFAQEHLPGETLEQFKLRRKKDDIRRLLMRRSA